MAFWNSSMMKTFLCGSLIGGIGAFLTMHYHVIRTDENVLFVPRVHQPPLRSSFVDVRQWTPNAWREFPDLSEAVTQAGRGDLLLRDGSLNPPTSSWPTFLHSGRTQSRQPGTTPEMPVGYPTAPQASLQPVSSPLTPIADHILKPLSPLPQEQISQPLSSSAGARNPFFQGPEEEAMPYPLQPIDTTFRNQDRGSIPSSAAAQPAPTDLVSLLQESGLTSDQFFTPTNSADSTSNRPLETFQNLLAQAEIQSKPEQHYLPLESLLSLNSLSDKKLPPPTTTSTIPTESGIDQSAANVVATLSETFMTAKPPFQTLLASSNLASTIPAVPAATAISSAAAPANPASEANSVEANQVVTQPAESPDLVAANTAEPPAAPPTTAAIEPTLAASPIAAATPTQLAAALENSPPEKSVTDVAKNLLSGFQDSTAQQLKSIQEQLAPAMPALQQAVEVVANHPPAPVYQVPTIDWVFAAQPESDLYSEGLTNKVAAADLAPYFQSANLKVAPAIQNISASIEGDSAEIASAPAPSQILRTNVGYSTIMKSLHTGRVKAVDRNLINDFQPHFPFSPRPLTRQGQAPITPSPR